MERTNSFVMEMSTVKDTLSNSLSRMSAKTKRCKKLRRQTAIIDVSYATDYDPEHQQPKSRRLSELPEPETGGAEEASSIRPDFDDDLSETISEATHTGSIDTFDRLSILSDSVPELLDADMLSQISMPVVQITERSENTFCPIDSGNDNYIENDFCPIKDSNTPVTDAEGWRVIPISIIPTTEIVIQRNVDSHPLQNVDNNPTEQSPNLSNTSVVSEKRKSVSPNIQEDLTEIEKVEEVTSLEIGCDVDKSVPVTSAVTREKPEAFEVKPSSSSVPATPMSEDKKRSKKSKGASPATALLEKSASWLTSLSGSSRSSNNSLNSKKEKKAFRFSTAKTKRSLTSLFEAVASSAPSSNNNNNSNSTTHTKNSMSNTLPIDFSISSRRTASSPEKLSELLFVTPSNISASSLSLTDLAEQTESNSSLALIRRNKADNHLHLNLSQHPDGCYTIDSRHSRKSLADKKLLLGVKQFNLDPKKGLEFLEKAGFLDSSSADEVANFLYREGRLSKKQIGAFIGDHRDFNKEVLKAFVAKHEFMNLILVQALRQFLWSFRLPGEAMQIDRIMEAFATHYCEQNSNLFDESDTCYILSFSIIMLNTALHNPNVKQKITLEQFVAQNRGINSGKDLEKEMLEQIYRSIKDEPFKIPNESYDDLMYTFFSPEKEGWLLKQGGSWKSWKRRWFVLSDRCLYYFEHTTENIPKGIIPLENVKVRIVDEKESRSFSFEVYSDSNQLVKGCKTDSRGTVVQGRHKTYRMSASSAEERDLWLDAIKDSIKEHPFYDIITTKKHALRRKSLRQMTQHDIPSTPSTPARGGGSSTQSTTNEPTAISYTVQT